MQKVILAITDGIGINEDNYFNAFAAAKKPNYQILEREALKCRLATSGEAVGLPQGQMGNSEVGHMCLGSGRVIFQSLVKISRACKDGSIIAQPAMAQLLERARGGASGVASGAANGAAGSEKESASEAVGGAQNSAQNSAQNAAQKPVRVHVFGLYSDGGVHSHFEHFNACLKLLADAAPSANICAHIITDGRDVLPKSAAEFFRKCPPAAQPASVAGRFYAMDRDNNHERTAAYINMLRSAEATGELAPALESAKSDEFVEPVMLKQAANIRSGDLALIINFRADRARQLAAALAAEGLEVTCMCEYDAALNLPVIFPPERVDACLAEVIAAAGLRQLHTSETEKYAHVSFFFNGGREQPYALEQRVLVPSTGAASYASTPKMSAAAIADAVLEGVAEGVEFVVLNFANGDMVGHTGDFAAAVQAVEEVDAQLGRLISAAREAGYALLVCSDHGNCEQMKDPATGKVLSNHTTFDVGCWLYNYAGAAGAAGGSGAAKRLADGTLANVAATVLEILNLPVPAQMQPSLLR